MIRYKDWTENWKKAPNVQRKTFTDIIKLFQTIAYRSFKNKNSEFLETKYKTGGWLKTSAQNCSSAVYLRVGRM